MISTTIIPLNTKDKVQIEVCTANDEKQPTNVCLVGVISTKPAHIFIEIPLY